MQTQIFALRVEPYRLVAAEVTDEAAATLLASGEQVLLGTFEDLGNLALRLVRPLVLISRASARPGTSRSQARRLPARRSPEIGLKLTETAQVASVYGDSGPDRLVAVSPARTT